MTNTRMPHRLDSRMPDSSADGVALRFAQCARSDDKEPSRVIRDLASRHGRRPRIFSLREDSGDRRLEPRGIGVLPVLVPAGAVGVTVFGLFLRRVTHFDDLHVEIQIHA